MTMSRRKITPDADVLTAAFRVISRIGPARLTLADVAKEAGLAPATLLQRFGSSGLLLAVAEQEWRACFARIRAAHRSPLAALTASLEERRTCETPEAMANSLVSRNRSHRPRFPPAGFDQPRAMMKAIASCWKAVPGNWCVAIRRGWCALLPPCPADRC
jgi:AcrR family transcriptional regulator